MTEIPPHLLERTRQRRLTLGLPAGASPETSDPNAAGNKPDAAPAPPTAAKGPTLAKTASAPAPAAPKPIPPYMQAYERRPKIPFWAMPVLIGLPIWAVFYAGTLQPPATGELTLAEEGAEVYAARCASCHGGGGGGGAGPKLSDGAVVQTFSKPVDHLRWLLLGSAGGTTNGAYGDNAKPSRGGMPAFQDALTAEELVAVVLHEREAHGKEEINAADWEGFEQLAAELGFRDEATVKAAIEKLKEEFPAS